MNNEAGLDRVLMDVAGDLQQGCAVLDMSRPIPSLEQMANAPESLINATGMPKREVVRDCG
jgi:hypothetical protein